MINIVREPSWGKIQSLINERFNKDIEYRYLEVIQNGISKSDERIFKRGDDLVVNLSHEGIKLGHVIVNRGSFLSSHDQMDLVDLIDFMVRPVVYNQYLRSLESALVTESKLNLSNQTVQASNQDSNVIEMNQFRVADFNNTKDSLDFDETLSSAEDQNEKSLGIDQIVSKFIHLRAGKSITRKKVALKIHEMLGHSFFIDYQQIANVTNSAQDLRDIDSTTIYIDDIQQIEQKDLRFLAEFLTAQEKLNIVLLVGSNLSDEKIHTLSTTQELKNDLVGFCFDIDRIPSAMQASDEVLEIMFFDDFEYSN